MQNVVVDHDVIFDAVAIAGSLVGARGADIADVIDAYDPDQAAAIIERLPIAEALKALDQPGIDDPEAIVALLQRDLAMRVLDPMSSDRTVALFRSMAEPARTDLLAGVTPDLRVTIERLLRYPEETARS